MISSAKRDTGRSKCNCCLACCSVFLVVFFSMIIHTITASGPVIFLKLAESSVGQYDAILTPNMVELDDYNEFTNDDSQYFNYSRIFDLYQDDLNISPRKQFCDTTFQKSGYSSTDGCIMLMDTNREK